MSLLVVDAEERRVEFVDIVDFAGPLRDLGVGELPTTSVTGDEVDLVELKQQCKVNISFLLLCKFKALFSNRSEWVT